MKRLTHAMAVSMAAASALALTAGAAQADTVVADPGAKVDYSGTLQILTKFGIEQLSPYFVGLAADYQKLHPDVKIELIQESDDSVKGKTKTLVASNAMPDIYFSWTGSWGGNFVRGNRAVDLTPVIGPDTEWGKTLVPAAVSAFQYNDKYFGIPLYLDAKFMGYSKKIFADAGVEVPSSFEGLLAGCDKIKEKGVTPISFGNKEAWPAVHYAGQLLAFNVPRATLEQDFDPKQATYSDPGYVTSLQQFKALIDRCTDGAAVNGTSYSSALQQLSNGKSAMYYQEIIEFDQAASDETELKRADFGFFVLPVPEGAKGDAKAVEGAPEGYMISSASKNIPLAIDFMKFATSADHGQVLSAPPYGQPSATVGGASEATMSPSVVNGLVELKSASYLMPWLDTANSPRVAAAWLSSLQALVGGSMTPEEVMTTVKDAAAADAN